MAAGWTDHLYQLHESRRSVYGEYIPAVRAGLFSRQRFRCLCGTDYRWRSKGVLRGGNAIWDSGQNEI